MTTASKKESILLWYFKQLHPFVSIIKWKKKTAVFKDGGINNMFMSDRYLYAS